MSERCVIALDLGGTALKAGLVDEKGETLRALQRPSRREQGPYTVVAGLCAAAEELAADSSPAAIGPVVPGVVDDAGGIAVLTFHRRPRLRGAALGDQAGRLGAALLAWELAAA